ncbi:Cof protein [Candidatus Paraburkholderia kirkii]|nr:Cof protein [Candidatus Paraburkholderia kirkii]
MTANGKYGLHGVSGDGAAAFEALARAELVVTDCDGTLLYTDKALGEPAKDAVRRLREVGVRFTVASSRPGRGMRQSWRRWQWTCLTRRTTAAAWFSRARGRCSRRASCRATSCRRRSKRSPPRASTHGCSSTMPWYLTHPDATYVPLETRTVGYEGVLVKRFDDVDLDAVDKIVGSTADTALLARVEIGLQTQLEGRGHAARSQAYYLDVTNLEANKGTAVRELAHLANVPLERVAVLGDMGNDMAMFEIAGVSIAMGQASETVRHSASLVSKSNDEDGFAIGVNALLAARSDR